MKIELYEREDGTVGVYVTGDLTGDLPKEFRFRGQPRNGKVVDVMIPLDHIGVAGWSGMALGEIQRIPDPACGALYTQE